MELPRCRLQPSSARPTCPTARFRSGWDGDGKGNPDDVDLDGDRFIEIPHKSEFDLGRELALRFADEVMTDSYDQVAGFFRRRGAYSLFKQLLASEGLLEQWYAFEAEAQERALREWCAENGIPLVDRAEKSS